MFPSLKATNIALLLPFRELKSFDDLPRGSALLHPRLYRLVAVGDGKAISQKPASTAAPHATSALSPLDVAAIKYAPIHSTNVL